MRNKNKIKRFMSFQLHELEAVKEYLEEMSLKGWMIEKIKFIGNGYNSNFIFRSGAYFTFKKIKPQKLYFSVDSYGIPANSFGSPYNSLNEFIDYCTNAGWKYICHDQLIYIFCSSSPNTVPIQTDDNIKLEFTKKSEIKFNLINFIFLLLTCSPFLFNVSFSDYITSNTLIFSSILIAIATFFCIYNILNFGIWYKKAKKSLEIGSNIKYKTYKSVKTKNISTKILASLILLFIAYMFVYEVLFKRLFIPCFIIFLLTLITIYICSKLFISKKEKFISIATTSICSIFIISIIISNSNFINNHEIISDRTPNSLSFRFLRHDEVPIKVDNFGINQYTYKDTQANYSKSIAAEILECNDKSFSDIKCEVQDRYISYSVFRSKYQWVLDHYLSDKLSDNTGEFSKIHGTFWSADEVYYNEKENAYIMVYNDSIVLFSGDINYNKNNIRFIESQLLQI